MSAAIRAEWAKLRTTTGPAWLLVATVAVTVAVGAVVSAAGCPQAGCPADAARLALSGVYLGQIPIAVLAVLTISGEYSTALIATTLTAIPSRPRVLAAKALVLAVVVAAAGSLTIGASLLAARLAPTTGPMLRAAAGSVLYLVLIALLSLGIATIVRDSGAAIGTVLGLLYLPPVLTQLITDPGLHKRLEQLAPMSAGPAVLATWAAATLLTGALLLRSRDT